MQGYSYFSYFCSKHRLCVHAEAVLTSTHNVCFGAKVGKKVIHLQTPVVFYIKVGFKGVYHSRTCFPDVFKRMYNLYGVLCCHFLGSLWVVFNWILRSCKSFDCS